MDMKGFVFSLDALFATIVIAIMLTATYLILARSHEDYFVRSQLTDFANDVLIVLDKEDIIDTHHKESIRKSLIENLPTNFGAKLSVTPYECKDEQCEEFEESEQVPPYVIIKGITAPVDVMLIIDRSSSMSDESCWWCHGGIGDAKNAAKLFIDELFSEDRAGLVSFGNSATLDHGLTSDKDLIKEKIDEIEAHAWPIQYTAIGEGIYTATEELNSNGREDATWVHILLSDCQNNRGRNPISAAEEAAESQVVIYTIGLGEDADEDILEDIANITGGKYYFSPTSEDLVSIYMDIAREIFGIEKDLVLARRGFLSFENGTIKYFCLAELNVWLI